MADRSGFQPYFEATAFQAVEYSHQQGREGLRPLAQSTLRTRRAHPIATDVRR